MLAGGRCVCEDGTVIAVEDLRSPPGFDVRVRSPTLGERGGFDTVAVAGEFEATGSLPGVTVTAGPSILSYGFWGEHGFAALELGSGPLSGEVDGTAISGNFTLARAYAVGEVSGTSPAGTFAHADGDTLTYRAIGSENRTLGDDVMLTGGKVRPGWLEFNASTRTFSGTPPPGSGGTTREWVTAHDETNRNVSTSFHIAIAVEPGLVGNLAQPVTVHRRLDWCDHAQKFTTGSHSTGYTVTSVDVWLSTVFASTSFPTVAIRNVTAGGGHGSVVGTLAAPASRLTGSGKLYRYTASAPLALEASTTYVLTFEGGSATGSPRSRTATRPRPSSGSCSPTQAASSGSAGGSPSGSRPGSPSSSGSRRRGARSRTPGWTRKGMSNTASSRAPAGGWSAGAWGRSRCASRGRCTRRRTTTPRSRPA